MLSSRQRYISEELTHFVGRGLDPEAQYSLLQKILRSGWLSHHPHDPMIEGHLRIRLNPDAKISENEMYLAQVVCFCDIPVEDFAIHIEKYSPFGLSFTKDFIVNRGGMPVFYIPREARVKPSELVPPPEILENWHKAYSTDDVQRVFDSLTLARYYDWMIHEYNKIFDEILSSKEIPATLDALRKFLDYKVFSYLVFFDHRLPDDHPDNFYFEREWRIVGNLEFNLDDVRRVILPKEYAKRFQQDCPDYCGQLTFVD